MQRPAFSWSHGQCATWEAVPPAQRDEVRDWALEVLAGLGDLTLTPGIRHPLGRRR